MKVCGSLTNNIETAEHEYEHEYENNKSFA
jgi:hypothetical protein